MPPTQLPTHHPLGRALVASTSMAIMVVLTLFTLSPTQEAFAFSRPASAGRAASTTVLYGRIVGENGTGIPSIVRVTSVGRRRWVAQTPTGPDGSYRVQVPDAGSYRVRVVRATSRRGGPSGSCVVHLSRGRSVRVDARLVRRNVLTVVPVATY